MKPFKKKKKTYLNIPYGTKATLHRQNNKNTYYFITTPTTYYHLLPLQHLKFKPISLPSKCTEYINSTLMDVQTHNDNFNMYFKLYIKAFI